MSAYMFNFNEYQDLALVEIGRQKCTPLYSFGPFIRNEYIFHYVLSGKGYCSYGHISKSGVSARHSEAESGPPEFEIKAGEGFLLEPHTKHIYYADEFEPWQYIWIVFRGLHSEAESGPPEFEIKAGEGFLLEPHTKHIYYADEFEPWQYIWIVFRGLAVPQYLKDCGLSKDNIIYRPKDYSNQTIQNIKSHLITILEHPNYEPAFIMGHFSLFFYHLIENSANHNLLLPPPQAKTDTFANYYLTQATRYINGNYPNIQSLDEIAHFCNVSRSHLGRLFRENLHISLQGYLIQCRLNKTRELLANTALSINEIAVRVGYQNELNLLRAFKKAYGISPNLWRKQNTL